MNKNSNSSAISGKVPICLIASLLTAVLTAWAPQKAEEGLTDTKTISARYKTDKIKNMPGWFPQYPTYQEGFADVLNKMGINIR